MSGCTAGLEPLYNNCVRYNTLQQSRPYNWLYRSITDMAVSFALELSTICKSIVGFITQHVNDIAEPADS